MIIEGAMGSAETSQVIDHEGGPLLVIGGPGTGKTTALEQRYLRLAQSPDLGPHRILFLCNNRSYGMQAKDRLAWALPHEAMVEIPVYTWHGFANYLVTHHYPSLGYRENPVLLTTPEQWGLVRELLADEDPSAWPFWSARLQDRAFVDEVADFCLRVEQSLLPDEHLQAMAGHRDEWAEVVAFFFRYREGLRERSRLDYATLMGAAVRLLTQDEGVRDTLRRRFPHVLVDDAQELSEAQIRLLEQLPTEHLVVASDPDSSIESFRGAQPEWTYSFENRFGPHTRIDLTHSLRIGEPLASGACRLIASNHESPEGAIAASAHETTYGCLIFDSISQESDAIARELRRRHQVDGVPWAQMAVLVSQPRFLASHIQRSMEHWEVPYTALSRDRSLATVPLIAAILDLVRAALKIEGWEELIPGLLTSPLFRLTLAQRRELERAAWQAGRSLADEVEVSPMCEEFRKLRDLVVATEAGADRCFWSLYRASRAIERIIEEAATHPGGQADADADALLAFSKGVGRFVERRHGSASMGEYIQEASRADFGADPWLAPSQSGGGVSLLTFHAAKGREWDTVIVAGCLDAWIPKGHRAQGLFDPLTIDVPDLVEREVESIAVDRRTFYVAATRARSRCLFTVSPGRGGRARPSRFLAELMGEELVESSTPAVIDTFLTAGEMRAALRRTLDTSDVSSPAQRAAAALALALVPGTRPDRWYGRWEWTQGQVPLEVEGAFKTSYSRLSPYENCHFQYLLQSVLGLDASSSQSMKFGSWMHSIFEAVHKKELTTPSQVKARFAELFDHSAFLNSTIARQFERDGLAILEVFWNNERKATVAKVEYSFEFPYEGAILRGRIDRIDQAGSNIRLIDYKTSKKAVWQSEASSSLQLAMYYLAARTEPELIALGPPTRATLVYPGDARGGAPKRMTQNPEEADSVIEGLPAIIKGVLSEEFAPSPEADCMWCRMKPLCPLWPQGREVE